MKSNEKLSEIKSSSECDLNAIKHPKAEQESGGETRWSIGELLLDTDPTVHVLYSQWKSRRCDYCFRSVSKLRRCSSCKFMFYCSKVCQERDWNPCHRVECKSKLALALLDLSKCVDALGRPRWKSAQIQLAFRLLIRWRLDPSNVWPNRYLSSMMNDGVSLGEYPRNTYPPSILLDGGVSNGGPAARGAIIRTAAIWARLVTNRYALNLFGTSGGGAFHRAVLLLDRHVIRVTDSSLVVRSLLSEHLVVGEAFYAPLLGIRHSCQPTAAFTFDNTRLQLRSIRPRLLPCDISVNYMDIVGAVHTLCLPADIRRPQLSLRGICCSCDLCRRPDCLLDGPLGSLFNALTRVGSHLFKHVNTQRCALQQLFRLSDQFCPGPHPTLTLMRLRLLYFELIAGCFAGAQTQLCLLLNEAAITHSGEQFDRCRPAFLALQEALQRGLKRDVEHAMEAVFDVKQFIPN